MIKPGSEKENTSPSETTNSDFKQYDEYWLSKARMQLDGDIDRYSRRLKTLYKFLDYLAAGTFFGGVAFTTYLKSTNLIVYLLFIVPLLTIAIGKYYVGVKGTEVISKETDMRSPTQINKYYVAIVKKLSEQVKEAASFVGIATGVTLTLLPFGIYIQNLEEDNTIDGKFLVVQYDQANLTINGNIPESKKVTAILYGKNKKKKVRTPITTDILIQKPGKISASLDLSLLDISLDSLDLFYSFGQKKVRSTYRYVENTASVKTDQSQNKKEQGIQNDTLTKNQE